MVGEAGQAGGSSRAGGGVGAGRRPKCVLPLTIPAPCWGCNQRKVREDDIPRRACTPYAGRTGGV